MEPQKILTITCQLNSALLDGNWSSSSEEGSSEDEVITNIVYRIKHANRKRNPVIRIENYIEHVIPSYSNQQFQSHFRVTREAYEALLRLVGPLLSRRTDIGRPTIDVEKQLLAVIWLLANPDCYRSIGDRFNIGKSSLSVSFVRVIRVLNRLARTVITWPTNADIAVIQEEFRRKAGMPNVIGVVDGTFIPIKAPKMNPEVYITRKCNHAITLQAICICNLKFTDIFVGYPGSVNDARIFRNSDIYQNVTRNRNLYFPNNEYIIGDKAYPVLPWCISSYINRGNLTNAQINFNNIMSRTRQTVERSFALLFGRFRRLKYLDMNRTDLVPATVLASCVLHNICLNHHDILIEDYIQDGQNNIINDDLNENIQYVNVNHHQEVEGRNRRDELCQLLYNNNHNEE